MASAAAYKLNDYVDGSTNQKKEEVFKKCL